jgi:mono/diheme cytochrome c family protein
MVAVEGRETFQSDPGFMFQLRMAGMKRSLLFGVMLVVSCLVGTKAGAQDKNSVSNIGPEAGRTVARAVYSVCHSVPDPPWRPLMNPPAPGFRVIANRSDATKASLLAFLRSTHKTMKTYNNMPALNITDDQADAVASYIMSLRKQP